MKKTILILFGLTVFASTSEASEWYLLNMKTMKCIPSPMSPEKMKKGGAATLEMMDGIFKVESGGSKLLIANSKKKCIDTAKALFE